jgi:serine/threonine protein phosphatase PrpC
MSSEKGTSSNLIVPFGQHSELGTRTKQQDTSAYIPEKGLAAVFDGHGPYGERAARHALKFLRAHPQSPEDLASLENFFREVHAHLLDSTIHPEGDGTTGLVAHLADTPDGYTITTGNVGNSHAMLLKPGGAHLLTTDHSAANLDEVNRLYEEHGVETVYSGTRFDATANAAMELSRMLGDRRLREEITDYHKHDSEQLFLATPAVKHVEVEGPAILAMFTDGVFRYHPHHDPENPRGVEQHQLVRHAQELIDWHQKITDQTLGALAAQLVNKFVRADNATALLIGLPAKKKG